MGDKKQTEFKEEDIVGNGTSSAEADVPVGDDQEGGAVEAGERFVAEIYLSVADQSLSFGLAFDSTTWDTDIRGYEILDVTDDGVIGVWNGNNAARPILAGDYVIAINSKTSFDDMMKELESSSTISLEIQKQENTAAEDPLASFKKPPKGNEPAPFYTRRFFVYVLMCMVMKQIWWFSMDYCAMYSPSKLEGGNNPLGYPMIQGRPELIGTFQLGFVAWLYDLFLWGPLHLFLALIFVHGACGRDGKSGFGMRELAFAFAIPVLGDFANCQWTQFMTMDRAPAFPDFFAYYSMMGEMSGWPVNKYTGLRLDSVFWLWSNLLPLVCLAAYKKIPRPWLQLLVLHWWSPFFSPGINMGMSIFFRLTNFLSQELPAALPIAILVVKGIFVLVPKKMLPLSKKAFHKFGLTWNDRMANNILISTILMGDAFVFYAYFFCMESAVVGRWKSDRNSDYPRQSFRTHDAQCPHICACRGSTTMHDCTRSCEKVQLALEISDKTYFARSRSCNQCQIRHKLHYTYTIFDESVGRNNQWTH